MNRLTHKTHGYRLMALLLVMMFVISCGGPPSEVSAPGDAASAAASGDGAGDTFAELALVTPTPYDPPIDMSSVIAVDATVRSAPSMGTTSVVTRLLDTRLVQ